MPEFESIHVHISEAIISFDDTCHYLCFSAELVQSFTSGPTRQQQGPTRRSTRRASDRTVGVNRTHAHNLVVSMTFTDFIAGGMAGSASILVGHPMDLIKV